MSDLDLDKDERAILSKGQNLGGRFKIYGNIKRLTEKNHKKVLKSLERKNLIEMQTYGVFELTDKAEEKVYGRAACIDCGAQFDSVQKARRAASLYCNHERLNLELNQFLKN